MNKKFILIGFIILIIVTAGSIYFYLQKNKKEVHYFYQPEQPLKNFKIYLPSSNGLITKEIYLKGEPTDLKNIEKLIENFLMELHLPLKETKLLGVYRDKENTVYVDFSKDFASPQDARGEYFMVKAFYKTLSENFEWIKEIKILIGSKETETIAGHVLSEISLKEIEEN